MAFARFLDQAVSLSDAICVILVIYDTDVHPLVGGYRAMSGIRHWPRSGA